MSFVLRPILVIEQVVDLVSLQFFSQRLKLEVKSSRFYRDVVRLSHKGCLCGWRLKMSLKSHTQDLYWEDYEKIVHVWLVRGSRGLEGLEGDPGPKQSYMESTKSCFSSSWDFIVKKHKPYWKKWFSKQWNNARYVLVNSF